MDKVWGEKTKSNYWLDKWYRKFVKKKRKEMSVMTIMKSGSGYFISIQEICNDA